MDGLRRNGSGISPGTPFDKATQANDRQIPVTTYNIHDILRGDESCPVTLGTFQFLVRSQAALHMASAVDNQDRLKTLLKNRGNTLRGFVLHGEGVGPVAYAVYYPMIDSNGSRVAYCEDFFIVESFRKYGAAKILFHELAKRTMQDNAEYLQWATDRRNQPVHGFVQNKLGARHPDVITIAASALIKNKVNLRGDWNEKDFVTRPLKAEDVNLPERLGLSPNIIRNTGDLPFKGFVTFSRSKTNEPIAITPGWTHLSTFQLKEGVHLEQPVFAEGVNKEAVMQSVITATRKHIDSNKLAYFRWHVTGSDKDMRDVLCDKLGLEVDSMVGTPESELVVYTLTNGSLKALADKEPCRVLVVPTNDPIGVPKASRHNFQPGSIGPEA